MGRMTPQGTWALVAGQVAVGVGGKGISSSAACPAPPSAAEEAGVLVIIGGIDVAVAGSLTAGVSGTSGTSCSSLHAASVIINPTKDNRKMIIVSRQGGRYIEQELNT
jgi:hypothetical protein